MKGSHTIRPSLVTLLASVVLTIPVAAHADTYLFTLTALSPTGQTGSFEIVSGSLPFNFSSGNYAEYLTSDSTPGTGLYDVAFYNAAGSGGFSDAYNQNGYSGTTIPGGQPGSSQMYVGDESDPTFVPGTYDFRDYDTNDTFTDEQAVVTDLSTAPEPSSLMLLGTGALGLAGAVRRRMRK